MEDIIGLLNCFTSGDNDQLNRADEYVAQNNKSQEFYENLLGVLYSNDYTSTQKQISGTLLYTQFKIYKDDRDWIPKSVIHCFKQNIIATLDSLSNDSVKGTKNVLIEIIGIMIGNEFPENWPELGDQIMKLLKACDSRQKLYSPLMTLQTLIKCYDRSLSSTRTQILEPVLNEFFPYIENLAGEQLKDWCNDSAIILTIIMECFKSANYLQMSQYVKQDQLAIWMKMTGVVLQNAIPDDQTNYLTDWEDIQERADNSHFWKAKIVSFEILFAMMRHCKPSRSSDQYTQEFQQHFNDKYAPQIIDLAFQFIKNCENFYIPPELLSLALRTMRLGVLNPATSQSMSAHFNNIMFEYCIPLLRSNSRDVEYWGETNQENFIYSEESEIDEHKMVKRSAGDLILAILPQNNAGGDSMIMEFMNYMMYAFTERKLPNNAQTPLTAMHEEYLLKALQVSGDYLSDPRISKKCLNELEQLLNKTAIPYLSSNEDILRYRACSVVESFGPMQYQQRQTYTDICSGLCKNMEHNKLAVQVKSVLALDYFLMNEIVIDMLSNDIKHVLNTVLTLLSKIELDALVEALQSISSSFSENISDFVEGIIQQLKHSYETYKQSSYENRIHGPTGELIDSEKSIECKNAAEMCLEAIGNILNSNLKNSVYKQITPIIMDLLNKTLINTEVEDAEQCFGFVNVILFKTQPGESVDDEIMFYYPVIVYFILGLPDKQFTKDISALPPNLQQILNNRNIFGNRIESFEAITSVLLNYMAKMGETFLDADDFYNETFPDLLMDLIREIGASCIQNDKRNDLYMSLRLAIGLMENFPNQVDHYMPNIISMAKEVMDFANTESQNGFKTTRKNNLKAQGCQVICMCFWYNPDLVMKYITENNMDILVKDLTNCLPLFTSDFEKERALFSLVGFCKMQPSLWPEVSTLFINQLILTILGVAN